MSPYSSADFNINPLMFYYEVTQACGLVCKHCRASAQEQPADDELSTDTALKLIEQVASFPRKPNICFTGGDPLKRADIFTLIEHAVKQGLSVALTPSATPLATYEALAKAKEAGVQALGISLDGPDAEVHDAFRGFAGSFAKTREMIEAAKKLQIPVQINTSITQRNFNLIDDLAEYIAACCGEGSGGVMMWSVFFLIPVGRGLEEKRIRAADYETVFETLWHHAQTKPFAVKTTEAPHYRRFVLRQGGNPLDVPRPFRTQTDVLGKRQNPPEKIRSRAPLGITDGRGIMFVSHNGTIYPAGFLPVACGQFPKDSLVDVYQRHPVFKALQNPDNFKGRCGRCEYRYVCGGSRSRAYAVFGDYLESEPDCNYVIGQDKLYKMES
ncbi:MAG: TIGR04053 family radical SAM/SPASM domain-containing protein [Planctomycetaceae bacterium]|jgi:radical SAM protein|nr:TIGR04053 family radical SAM/SPASM domain-containing protein [Planctomycetaceae bacterium]